MPDDGLSRLELGQIPFPSSYTPLIRRHGKRHRAGAPLPSDAPSLRIGPMFELGAGRVERPLKERSSLATTLISSLAHGGALVVGVIVLTLSQGVVLPQPQDASNLIAILIAAPPPPPPPAPAAAAPEPAAAAPARTEPPPEVMPTAAPPQVAPVFPGALPEEPPPVLVLPPPPSLSVGFGSGVGSGSGSGPGSGFGVEGGVGFGAGMSEPGLEPVRVGAGVETPQLVHRVEATYPRDAVAARIEGTVVVEATVDERGEVQEVRVLRSIRSLDQAAIDAVMQWRYSPLRPASAIHPDRQRQLSASLDRRGLRVCSSDGAYGPGPCRRRLRGPLCPAPLRRGCAVRAPPCLTPKTGRPRRTTSRLVGIELRPPALLVHGFLRETAPAGLGITQLDGDVRAL